MRLFGAFLVCLCLCVALVQAAVPTTNVPFTVHIAFAGSDELANSNGMAVSWQTNQNTPTSTVKFGLKSQNYDISATGGSTTYYETYHHHVVLSNLLPATTYYYVVGDDANGWSKEFKFITAGTAAGARGNFTFAFFADLGSYSGEYSIDYVNTIKDSLSMVWHGGDVGYPDDSFLHKGCFLKFCYEEAFNNFMTNVEPWAAQVPYMVVVGNHETECHDFACLTDPDKRHSIANFTSFNNRFRMPSAESKGTLNMHYSFNMANAHFISIDTETGYPGAAEEKHYVLPSGGFGDQLNWLEADLKKANAERALRPWIFVSGHRPFYQGAGQNTQLQAAVEDMLYKYGVDVYFTGHVHSYERDWPVYKGEPEKTYDNPRATTHILIGGSGCDDMRVPLAASAPAGSKRVSDMLDRAQFDPASAVHSENTWVQADEDGPWTVVTDKLDHLGIGLVHIVDDNTLKFNYVRTVSGEVFDSMTLTRDHSLFIRKFAPVAAN